MTQRAPVLNPNSWVQTLLSGGGPESPRQPTPTQRSRESQYFRPSFKTMGIGKERRQPYQQPKTHDHRRGQSRREAGHQPGEQSDSGKSKRGSGCHRPEHLSRRNPFRNKTCRCREIEKLFQRERDNTNTERVVPNLGQSFVRAGAIGPEHAYRIRPPRQMRIVRRSCHSRCRRADAQ